MHHPAVLCIAHSNEATLGRFPSLLADEGVVLSRVNFLDGQELPKPVEAFDLIIVFGGKIGAEDLYMPGLSAEYKVLERAASISIPILGICLGGQIMSRILGGGAISRSSAPEIGFHEIHPARPAKDLFWHRHFFQWHWDDMPCPPGAENLGQTERFECQAFRHDRTLALQFHPDAELETIRSWMEAGRETIAAHSAKAADEHLADSVANEINVGTWTARLLHMLLKQATGKQSPVAPEMLDEGR